MGCALSKDSESPSKGFKGTSSSWAKVIHRRFTLQINRSLKTTDGGYIAAVLSANYGILRRHAPVKALDASAFPQHSSQTEIYPTHERRSTVKPNANTHPNLAADIVLGIPRVGIKSPSALLEAPKSNESTKENLETINILELMEGLAEEDVSTNLKNLQECSNALPPDIKLGSLMSTYGKVPASEALPANKMSRRSRPKSMSSIGSIRSVEGVDMALSARRGEALLPLKSSREVQQQKQDMDAEAYSCMGNTISDSSSKPHDGNIDITIPECPSISTFNDLENLPSALSFRYMSMCSSGERQNSFGRSLNALDAPVREATSTICRSDSLVLAAARFLLEVEGTTSPASPEFSTVASLEEWLPSSSQPSMPNILPSDHRSSNSDTFQFLQPPWEAPLSRVSVLNQWTSLQCENGPELQDCGIPIFDPEMVDSFENAMRHLSKEEWDAVRGMEDSPRNFLRLVKALKKSRSNSLRIQKEKAAILDIGTLKPDDNAGKDSKDLIEPSKSPGSKSKVAQRMGTFMRHNSLEVMKAYAEGRAEDDDGTARVVFYSSTAQVGSKAYEDCSQVRSILQSLVGICYREKSVSELEEHEQELRHALNVSIAIVPTIYVKGKYLVGIDSILHLYKKGLLGSMLREDGGSRLKGGDAMHLHRYKDPCLLPTSQS